MKELSKETIEIDGQDYTLFLNRAGIVAWEKYARSEKKKIQNLKEKYNSIINEKVVEFDKLNDDTNPFEGLENVDDITNDAQIILNMYKRLYWIMLYSEHQLSISQASELFDKAVDEYGEEQIIALGDQMVNEVNTNPNKEKELKNLTALKPRMN